VWMLVFAATYLLRCLFVFVGVCFGFWVCCLRVIIVLQLFCRLVVAYFVLVYLIFIVVLFMFADLR